MINYHLLHTELCIQSHSVHTEKSIPFHPLGMKLIHSLCDHNLDKQQLLLSLAVSATLQASRVQEFSSFQEESFFYLLRSLHSANDLALQPDRELIDPSSYTSQSLDILISHLSRVRNLMFQANLHHESEGLQDTDLRRDENHE